MLLLTAGARHYAVRRCPAVVGSAQFRWFDPLSEFGPLEEPRPAPQLLPLLIVLPGLDGSGITAWTQYPQLAQEYELQALSISPADRSSFDTIVAAVADRATEALSREVFVLGESMGAGVAIQVARQLPKRISGVILVSPATSWDETWLGRMRGQLVVLPDPLLALIVSLTSYQLLDAAQILSTFRRILTGERAALLDTPERLEYAWRVVRAMPSRLSSPPGTIRHRIAEWVEPTLAAGRAVADLTTPILIVAGTADLRVPAAAEARRIGREARSLCHVHFVEGAGHAGATDDRVDMTAVLASWRSSLRDQ